MPRTRRAAAKKAPSPKPEPKVTRRRTRNSLKAQLEALNNEDDQVNTAQENLAPPPTKSLGHRKARSRKSAGIGGNDVEEPEELPIRKRQKRAKPQDEAPARKSARGKQKPQEVEADTEVIPESEPEAEPEDVDNDESAPTSPTFYNNLNLSILPEGDRSGIAFAGQDGGGEDGQEENHDTAQAEPPELEDDNNQTQHTPSPQAKQSKPGRRGRRRQSKKAAYGESEDRKAREASVELGADIPSARKRRLAPEEQQVDKPLAEPIEENEENNNERDVYEVDNDESPDKEEKQDVPKSSKFDVDTDEDEDEDQDDEPQNGDTTMAGEDSLFICAPTEETKVILTDIASKWIGKITSLMKLEGWTGSKEWTHNFTIPKGKTKETWLNRQERHLHPDQFRVLFRHLYGLWEICNEMPRAPAFKLQFEYWKEHESDLGKSIKIIRSVVEDISKNMQIVFATPINERNEDSEWGDLAFDILCIKIIPMVVHVLEESFKVGGVVTLSSGAEVGMSDKCRFTSTTLQLPLLIVGWLQRLYTVVAVQISVDFPETVNDPKARLRRKHAQRKKLEGHLNNARAVIQQGTDQLDYLAEAPQREMEEKEKKQALELAREKQQEEQREADERRMELFVKSIRRMNGSAPAEPRPPSRDDYSERHEGWHYHEDDALLSMIRKIRNPNLRALVPLVPGRSEEEVTQRVRHLRERMRVKYEAKGEVPPLWCYPLT